MQQMNCQLTPQQAQFMQDHHAEIHQASTQLPEQSLTYLYTSAEYKAVFGNMLWDDALDRYQDWLVETGNPVDWTQVDASGNRVKTLMDLSKWYKV